MKEIKILGVNTCKNCTNLKEDIENLIKEYGLNASVEKVTDPKEFLKYKILSSPGIVIDGSLVHSGGIPQPGDLKKLLGIK